MSSVIKPVLVVLTGPRPPEYGAVFDPTTGEWAIQEDGVMVSTGRNFTSPHAAVLEAARISEHRWSKVGTGQLWPPMDPVRLPARYIIIPRPPSSLLAWSRN